MQNGSSWRGWSVSLWGFFFFIFFSIALLVPTQGNYASEPSDSINSLRTHLLTINAQVTILENESRSLTALSAESEQRVRELQEELSMLRQELLVWRVSSEESQRQVDSLDQLLQRSEEKLRQVSGILRASADSWKAVADAERLVTRKWRVTAVVGILGALLLGGLAGWALGR